MKLQKIKEIENTYSVVQLDNTLLVSHKDGSLYSYNSDELNEQQKIESNLKIMETFRYNEITYLISTRNKLFVQDEQSFTPFLSEYYCTRSTEIENSFMVHNGDIGSKSYCIYSLSKKEILWKLDSIPIETISNYCFSRKKTKFKARDIETGKVLWEKTITDDFLEAKNYKFFTVYNKVLVIAVNDSILAGYNVETGELLWSVNKTNNRNLLVDIDGKLKGVTSTGYFETEIETGIHRRIEFAPYEAINEPGWFDSQRDTFVIIDNHIITTDFFSNRIGAFNLETLQYDWFYTEENTSGFPASRPIKYFAPYLCVIDNADTLHIYKMNDLIT